MSQEEILTLICSHKRFERERGVSCLERLIKSWEEPENKKESSEQRKTFQDNVLSLLEEIKLSDPESTPEEHDEHKVKSWEKKQGCLAAFHPLIESSDTASDAWSEDDQAFLGKAQEIALDLLKDEEARVRQEAGEVLGTLCQKVGASVYLSSKDRILELIRSSIESLSNPHDSFDIVIEELKTPSVEITTDFGTASESKEKIFHETAGLKDLESHDQWNKEMTIKTHLKCLEKIIEKMKGDFLPFIDTSMLELVLLTLNHSNRFVRENGFYLASALVESGPLDPQAYGKPICERISVGLSDKWIQVRLAASFATRKLLLSNPETREEYFPSILPKLCLNRYYMAEGVRIYSQETWKLVMKEQGRDMVAKYAGNVIDYYISTTNSDDKAEREAACACCSELVQKINPQIVSPYVEQLITALIPRFHDHFWPARDAACLACGNAVLHFPDESRNYLEKLNELFFKNLGDPVPSIRQGAAASLSHTLRAYKGDVLTSLIDKIKEGLATIESQPKNTDLEPEKLNPESERLSPVLSENDPDVQDAFLLSLGPLTSKRRSSGATILLEKKPEPWEYTDGTLYLIGEISEIDICKPYLIELIPLMLEAIRFRHFSSHLFLLENFCKILPLFAKGIGKKDFKAHLNSFFEPIFYSIESNNALTSMAGQNCLKELGNLVGKTIMMSRIELYDPKFVVYYSFDDDN